jgi:hypothetical protein
MPSNLHAPYQHAEAAPGCTDADPRFRARAELPLRFRADTRWHTLVGDFADVVRSGRAALEERHAPLDESERARAEALVADALHKVAVYVVDAQPSSAEVAVDGEPVPIGPGRELVIPPGHHMLRAIADGYVPRLLEVDAVAGKRDALMFTLHRANAPSILALVRAQS